ncbi:MAG: O-methyltransferase [Anaerolineae bacterium]|nr:O-methyltransferase [Anaerolineae bacterium]
MTIQEKLVEYVRELYAVEDEALRRSKTLSIERGIPQINIRPEEGRILQLMLMAVGAKKVVEIGTLAGYSGTWMARALPEDGRLISLEIEEEHAEAAREVFEKAGVGDRVEIRVGPAMATLVEIEGLGPFDAVFIDADKTGYPDYLAWAVENLRVGGLVMAHNTFRRGNVVNPEAQNRPDVIAMKQFNERLANDPRLLGTIIPVGDGIGTAIRVK